MRPCVGVIVEIERLPALVPDTDTVTEEMLDCPLPFVTLNCAVYVPAWVYA
jgi:hypothetical protein